MTSEFTSSSMHAWTTLNTVYRTYIHEYVLSTFGTNDLDERFDPLRVALLRKLLKTLNFHATL